MRRVDGAVSPAILLYVVLLELTRLLFSPFSGLASEYDRRFEKVINQLVKEIQKRRDFIGIDWVQEDSDDEDDNGDTTESSVGAGKTVKVLDYACGTGLVSRALAQYTTQCVGIDVSEKMVAAFNARAENQGLSASEMRAYHGNLIDPSDPSPAALAGAGFTGFDLAVVGLGFHHFDDPEYAAKQLVARLKPGGVLLIIDFFEHGNHGHAHDDKHGHGHGHARQRPANGVMHHGFSEERMRAMFEGAGAGINYALQEVGSGVVFHGADEDRKRRVFMARGTKA
ncbi:Putative coatomer subunit alpha [Verticillium dahliae VDG1]|nr:Putative coatomer subunit alpha [Verticillium dahliae VDG1]